jgi:hypothetical protein
MARNEMWVTRGALGAVAGAQLLFGMPGAAGADGGVSVTGEGDCDALDVVVSGMGSSSVGVSEGTNYSVSDACTVTSSDGVETSTGGVPTEQAEASSFYQTAPAAAAPDSLAAAGFVGNWVHTSQTLQDVIFIDISKLRFHTDRH